MPAAAGVRRLLLIPALVAAASCGAVKSMAMKSVASTLSETGNIASHDDPDTIEAAIPPFLVMFESLADQLKDFEPIHTATCALYTQYAFGFIAPKGERAELQDDDFDTAKAYNERALRLATRGRDFCWRGLEVKFRGVSAALKSDPAAALRRAKREQVPLLYWSAASLGAAISSGGLTHPELLNQWPVVRALAERAIQLDDAWNKGALHELMITVESQGEAFGGSEERARTHFARAVELQQGLSPGPHVALAMGVVKTKQDRPEFEKLMKEALSMDPEKNPTQRLIVLITQRRAQLLLDNVGKLILTPEARIR
jgi:hypothetical protein